MPRGFERELAELEHRVNWALPHLRSLVREYRRGDVRARHETFKEILDHAKNGGEQIDAVRFFIKAVNAEKEERKIDYRRAEVYDTEAHWSHLSAVDKVAELLRNADENERRVLFKLMRSHSKGGLSPMAPNEFALKVLLAMQEKKRSIEKMRLENYRKYSEERDLWRATMLATEQILDYIDLVATMDGVDRVRDLWDRTITLRPNDKKIRLMNYFFSMLKDPRHYRPGLLVKHIEEATGYVRR